MMKQRRRLLSLISDYDTLLAKAVCAASGGNNKDNQDTAQISQSALEDGREYYLFGYCEKNFAVCKYYNGEITDLYNYNRTNTYKISMEINSGLIQLKTGTSYTRRCHGITALKFGAPMDSFFTELSLVCSDGLNTAGSSYYWPMLISQFYEEPSEYVFAGCAERFCIYKLTGIEIQDFQLLFSNSLCLRDYNGDTTQLMISATPTGSAIKGWGSTVFSIRR